MESHIHGQCFPKICSYGLMNKDQLGKYGYALCGQRAVCRRLLVHGKPVSAIATLSTEL